MHQYSLHIKTTHCFSLSSSLLQRCAPVQPTCPDSVLLFYFSSTAEMHSSTVQYSTYTLNPVYTAYIQQHFHSLPRLQCYGTTIAYDYKADGAKCTASTEAHAGSYSGLHHQHKDSQHNPNTLYPKTCNPYPLMAHLHRHHQHKCHTIALYPKTCNPYPWWFTCTGIISTWTASAKLSPYTL